MITKKPLLCASAVVAFGTMFSAQAEDTASQDGLTVGLAGQNVARYSGASSRHWQFAPVVQYRQGAFFVDSQKGIGADLQSDNGLYLEGTLGYAGGRTEKSSTWRDGDDKLKGMGNIKPVVNTALAAGWMLSSWLSLEGKVTLPLSDSQGAQYQGSVTLVPWQDDRNAVALQSAALFGDSRYINTFYGVNPVQSQRSGYTRYDTRGGWYGMDTSLTWRHQFTPHWATAVTAGYTWLADRANDSPIVFKRDQTRVGLALTYGF